ncbi:MAG: nucleoside diphosphate kinase regulator [Flavobacteriaceae bacterium]
MAAARNKNRKPSILVGQTDHEKLTRLAEAAAERNPVAAGALLDELDRAEVVAEARLRGNVVRMGSTLRYATETGETRTVTLVYPGEADIAAGKISILTPIGAALIGLSAGQSIDWQARDGRIHRLSVESVTQPAAEALPA